MTAQSDPPHSKQGNDPSLTFPRTRRIRSGLDFERIYGLKQKSADSRLVIFAARNSLGLTRIGLSVSRKHGNSVVRHRLRRMLREAYRLAQHQIAEGLDLILIPGREAAASTQPELQRSMVQLARRLANRLLAEGTTATPDQRHGQE
ncbi:ribonuclease P protein component [Planctomicrobium sp. SH661]|uniref:ribonuclease P protein component n=1 Tax=Planctomicrobium sp. SH661 TaxID=3448124 RepID=UPI003F5BA518